MVTADRLNGAGSLVTQQDLGCLKTIAVRIRSFERILKDLRFTWETKIQTMQLKATTSSVLQVQARTASHT